MADVNQTTQEDVAAEAPQPESKKAPKKASKAEPQEDPRGKKIVRGGATYFIEE